MKTHRQRVLVVQAPRLSSFTLARASTLHAVSVRSPTLRCLRLGDMKELGDLVVDAPVLESLDVIDGTCGRLLLPPNQVHRLLIIFPFLNTQNTSAGPPHPQHQQQRPD